MPDPFLESVLSSFDSQTRTTWHLISIHEASAWFEVEEELMAVSFRETRPAEWRVGFDVRKSTRTSQELVLSSFRIFSGVFQVVEEFLTVRQPERLVFASKQEGLGRLYEAYLDRQDTTLRTLGYEMDTNFKAAPLSEYAIVKRTLSHWSNASSK